ncbi:MAG: BREX-2 system phosphatase PglZ [Pseudonocardia sp.]|nr:BREX-2 system phosphatase PglZ [Pseudonocardia sp.]
MTAAAPLVGATLPVLRAMLDEARAKDYRCGVLGVRAVPRWDGPEVFEHETVPVRVAACVSALAVREALLDVDPDGWLVVLTDRTDADLGAGLLGHLVWQRMRNPDPWAAVTARFAASAISAELVTRARNRDLAMGLLAAQPAHGWPPAPGGVLTATHTFASVARQHLHLPDVEVDGTVVLGWTTRPGLVGAVADLRSRAGDVVVDAVLGWMAARSGGASGPLAALMTSGAVADALPLGLVAGIVHAALRRSDPPAEQARIRMEPRLGGRTCTDGELAAWGREADAALDELTDRDLVAAQVHRADTLLVELHATALATASDDLPSGLTERLRKVAERLRAAVASGAMPIGADEVLEVDEAWASVATHRLARPDDRVMRFRAAVRLLRWLGTADQPAEGLGALLARHRDDDGWVDAAVNDASPGVGDADLGAALGSVLAAVRARRAPHDREFAVALAAHTAGTIVGPEVLHLEALLAEVVLPIASVTPTLLVVVDGMSVAVATEVIASATADRSQGWLEAMLPGHTRRAAALAVLPTLTRHSRCSLLSGRLASGEQDAERRGFQQALQDRPRLAGAPLFHKKVLETTRLGMAVADEVGSALDDATGRPLVACVLNTVDDALDRSDPVGTDWTVDTVRHLNPLLERAARSGRTVVLTSDHGHVVERRRGTQRAADGMSSARSRPASGPVPEADEVLVRGERVLDHNGAAVLAVDEDLRYGPLKAGYHGGASPAEAVVPVAVLVPGAEPEDTGLRVVAPYEPPWWSPAAAVRASAPLLVPDRPGQAELFATAEAPTAKHPLAGAVLASSAFAATSQLAGRGLATEQLAALLGALLDAPNGRVTQAVAADRLDVPPARLRGAIAHAQRLLNVEGYPVLRIDVDGAVVLDEGLLREQFSV